MSFMQQVGILYNSELAKARDVAARLGESLSTLGVSSWQCPAWEENKAKKQVTGSDLLLSVGGDGTMLHAAHISAPANVPILGINLGKLGFITELSADEAVSKLPDLLKGAGWIEERAMLEARLGDENFYALNDVVVRSTSARLINVKTEINGGMLAIYRSDGVIIATATGSTGYSLAAGGPILHPQSKEIILQPISCHLGLNHTLVLPSQSVVDLKVVAGDKGILSLDGQVDISIYSEQNIRVKLSTYVARFLKTHQPKYFYSSLRRKLRGKEQL